MSEESCEDCNGTGYSEIEGMIFGRPQYSEEYKKIITPYITDGIWKRIICHCQSDED